jgi:hypothetical protein
MLTLPASSKHRSEALLRRNVPALLEGFELRHFERLDAADRMLVRSLRRFLIPLAARS